MSPCLMMIFLMSINTPTNSVVAVDASIERVGLFKNGMALVRQRVTLMGPGDHELTDLPVPIHGTYWIESDRAIESLVTTRDVEVRVGAEQAPNLQRDLVGRTVTLHFKNGMEPIRGRVLGVQDDEPTSSTGPDAWGTVTRHVATPPSRFLMIQDPQGGHLWIDHGTVAMVRFEGEVPVRMKKEPVLRLRARGAGPHDVVLSYLTRGLSWAPSYRVDLTQKNDLTLTQKAIVRNELTAMRDVTVELISGFPAIEFKDVRSPLAARSTWNEFFTQLAGNGSGTFSNVATQMAIASNASPYMPLSTTAPMGTKGDGVDLHYHSIGHRSLGLGEAMALDVATAATSYERLVEWDVPDSRDRYGRYDSSQGSHGEAWDAIRFENPFEFPMTTAPAMIEAKGRFQGQGTLQWVNPGERTTLRITKALSLRTRASERELPGEREIIYVGGRRFRETEVEGELLMCNHRDADVFMIVKRRFSGEFVRADDDPEVGLLEEGVFSVNQRNALTWNLTLSPGEVKTLKYRYKVLVSH